VLESALGILAILGVPLIRQKFGQGAASATDATGKLLLVPAGYEFFKTVFRDVGSLRLVQALSVFSLIAAFLYVLSTLFPTISDFLHEHKRLQWWTPALLALGTWAYGGKGALFAFVGFGFWAVLPFFWIQELYKDDNVGNFFLGREVMVTNKCPSPLTLKLAAVGPFGAMDQTRTWNLSANQPRTRLVLLHPDGAQTPFRTYRQAVFLRGESGERVWRGQVGDVGFQRFEKAPSADGKIDLIFCAL
jgi:hypothetical protein